VGDTLLQGALVTTGGVTFQTEVDFDFTLLISSLGSPPGATASRLYNEGGTLKWSGNRVMLGSFLHTELLKINTAISSNASTPMPNYTRTLTMEDAAGNTIKVYGTA
jgi:hypothetical protein